MPKRNNTCHWPSTLRAFGLTAVCADRAKPLARGVPEDRLLAETELTAGLGTRWRDDHVQ